MYRFRAGRSAHLTTDRPFSLAAISADADNSINDGVTQVVDRGGRAFRESLSLNFNSPLVREKDGTIKLRDGSWRKLLKRWVSHGKAASTYLISQLAINLFWERHKTLISHWGPSSLPFLGAQPGENRAKYNPKKVLNVGVVERILD